TNIEVGENGEFSIIAMDRGNDEREELQGAWFEPSVNYIVPQYEKAEWGIKLPLQVQNAINNWIHNYKFPNEQPLSPALNPFDPEAINVWSDVKFSGDSYRANGFYYIPYEREMSDPDKNNWDWSERSNEYSFRFRFSPWKIATHEVTIDCDVPGMGHWQLAPFRFESAWGDPKRSFITSSSNGHYFVTADNEVFFPVGLNINALGYSCSCDNQNSLECSSCYDEGEDDPCCGISELYRNGDDVSTLGLRKQCLPLASYLKFERIREQLVESGANSFRFFLEPKVFDIEFEKLNNYHERQYQAFELDQMLDDCHRKKLRIQWNLQMHTSITYTSYGIDRWDWDFGTNMGQPITNREDYAWCYKADLGLDTPLDFLQNEEAKSYYKKKLRYIIARWGYSPDVYSMEMMSEMNNVGGGDRWICHDTDQDGVCEGWPHYNDLTQEWVDESQNETAYHYQIPRPYDTEKEIYRPAVRNWHDEMSRYIKLDLGHRNHLLAADYAGAAPFFAINSLLIQNACLESWFDSSWNLPYVDVISMSNYSNSPKRWEAMSGPEYAHYLCGEIVHDDPEVDYSVMESLLSFSSLYKPIAYGENGSGMADMQLDITGFVKDLLASSLSGHASAGMSWGQAFRRDSWKYMGYVKSFVESEFFISENPQEELWEPFHCYSKKLGLGASHSEEMVECMYMKKEDDLKAVGVLMNRTWNWITQCNDCPSNDEDLIQANSENGPWGEESFLSAFHEIGSSDYGIRLNGLNGLARYKIKYYEFGPTPILINEEYAMADEFGRLELVNYPLLNANRPNCFFKAYHDPVVGQDHPFYPTYSDHEGQLDLRKVEKLEGNSVLTVQPSPFTSTVQIGLSNTNIQKVRVLDLQGRIVFEGTEYSSKNLELNLGFLVPSVYTVIVNETFRVKIIKT
ncbi:MAG: hypothetical protein RL092_1992, partial [Bacteroidota bacterium]